MIQNSFFIRTGIPVGSVLLILYLTTVLINDGLGLGLLETWGGPYTAAIALRLIAMLYATYLIYPLAFFYGAGPRERILASFTPHFVWIANEFIHKVAVFSVGETLFSIFNPGFLFFTVRTFFQIALCETVCRWIIQKRHGSSHLLSIRQTRVLLIGSPVLQGLMGVFFLTLINIYWLIQRGVF
jgi:hypothetical protein